MVNARREGEGWHTRFRPRLSRPQEGRHHRKGDTGNVTRVIAGAAGGRRLAVPGGTTTRPTSDRAREGLFATVLSEFGDLGGVHVMDLYAGSGALGLEALSRGAASVLLVESDVRAAAVVKANVAAVGLPGATVAVDKVERLLARPPGERGHQRAGGYDLVFADPPYAVTDEAVTRRSPCSPMAGSPAERSSWWSEPPGRGRLTGPPATPRESRAGTVRPRSGTAGTATARRRVKRD